MRRSVDLYLQDMLQAGKDIQRFTEGKTLQDYVNDRLLSAAVERLFEIIGEALSQRSKYYPNEEPVTASQQRIIDFRNRIIHGYFGVNDEVVWSAVKVYLPAFLDDVAALIERRHRDQVLREKFLEIKPEAGSLS